MRVPAVVFILLVVTLAVASGCTCGKSTSTDGGVAVLAAPAADATMITPAELSLPIGAAHGPGHTVLVAGLAAARHAIALSRLEPDGTVAWTRDVFTGVAWTPDADVRVYANPDGGAFVLVRASLNGAPSRVMASVDAEGKPRGAVDDVGSTACSTRDGVTWVRRDGLGKSSRMMRNFADGHGVFVGAIPEGDPTLVCGDHHVFTLLERDDGLGLMNGDTVTMLLTDRDFSGDARARKGDSADEAGESERDHIEYTIGDELGILSPGRPGVTAFRGAGGTGPSAWRKIVHRFGEDDDVVAVDGDARALFVLATSNDGPACPDGESRARLHLVRVGLREPGERDTPIAAFECGVSAGPFWTGFVAGKLVVGWPERAPKKAPDAAPVNAFAFVTVADDRAADPVRRPLVADGVVDAGCDEAACYAVALTRPEGTDGMVPGPARVLRYPL